MKLKYNNICVRNAEPADCEQLAAWWNDGRVMAHAGFAERVFHVHLRFMGDNDEIAFRDYLNGHPDTAREYEQLKLSLWKDYEHDRDGYTEAKTEFIRKCMKLAGYGE